MDAVRITEAELLEALADATRGDGGPPQAMTTPELAEALGIGVERVHRTLKVLAAQGRLGVHKVQRTSIDGRAVKVPGYTIKPVPRATKKKPAKRRG